MVKNNALKYFMALFGMWPLSKGTEQKLWMLKCILIVASTSTASLAQGTVIMSTYSTHELLFILKHTEQKFGRFEMFLAC